MINAMGRNELAMETTECQVVAGMVVREGLTGEVAFEQSPVGGRERASSRILGGEHSRQKEQQVQRP